YTGLEEIVIGAAIHEKYAGVAAFNKTLALRTRVDGASTLRRFLDEARRAVSEAYANQKYPFDRLLEALNVEAPANREPLFSAVLIYDRINNAANVRHLRNDFTLAFSRRDGALVAFIEYSAALFKRETIEVFGEHYLRVLRAVMERTDDSLADIDLLQE